MAKCPSSKKALWPSTCFRSMFKVLFNKNRRWPLLLYQYFDQKSLLSGCHDQKPTHMFNDKMNWNSTKYSPLAEQLPRMAASLSQRSCKIRCLFFHQSLLSTEHHKWASVNAPQWGSFCFELGLMWGAQTLVVVNPILYHKAIRWNLSYHVFVMCYVL